MVLRVNISDKYGGARPFNTLNIKYQGLMEGGMEGGDGCAVRVLQINCHF